MEGRFFLEEESKMNRMCVRQPISSNCSSSSLTKEEGTDCSHKAAECACSACLLCVSCPLCIAWCCIKLPCKIVWQAAKNARNWNCCGSQKKVYASYSSFSDIELDSVARKIGASSSSSSSSINSASSRCFGSSSSSASSSSRRMHRHVKGTGKQKS